MLLPAVAYHCTPRHAHPHPALPAFEHFQQVMTTMRMLPLSLMSTCVHSDDAHHTGVGNSSAKFQLCAARTASSGSQPAALIHVARGRREVHEAGCLASG